MVKKFQIQDPNGNIVYLHTSSDIVFDDETGVSVKEELKIIKNALGIIENGISGPVDVCIDAKTLAGHTIDEFVTSNVLKNAVDNMNSDLNKKAPINSPEFTGNPTTPDVNSSDASGSIANTRFVKRVLESYTKTGHEQAASSITAGTFKDTGVKAKAGNDYTTCRIRNASIISSAATLPTNLEDGAVLLVYDSKS